MVEVNAGAVTIETETVNYKQVVDQERINELPLNGRQLPSFVLVTGGAVTAPGNDMVGSKNYASSTVIALLVVRVTTTTTCSMVATTPITSLT